MNYGSANLVDTGTIPGSDSGGAVTLGAEATVSLADYAGRWVKLYSLDDQFLFCFQAEGVTTVLVETATAVDTAGVPDAGDSGPNGVMRFVPKKATQLRHKAIGAGGVLRIIPA